jgi:hypothetical protein
VLGMQRVAIIPPGNRAATPGDDGGGDGVRIEQVSYTGGGVTRGGCTPGVGREGEGGGG